MGGVTHVPDVTDVMDVTDATDVTDVTGVARQGSQVGGVSARSRCDGVTVWWREGTGQCQEPRRRKTSTRRGVLSICSWTWVAVWAQWYPLESVTSWAVVCGAAEEATWREWARGPCGRAKADRADKALSARPRIVPLAYVTYVT